MVILKINEIKVNPNNPRLIKDVNFKRLVNSVKDFPEMLKLRPIVVNKDMVILGGNMRFKACVEAGIKEVPVIIADNLTEEQENEFLIKDNVSGGEWDWDILANEWNSDQLVEWGLDVWQPTNEINLDDFFEDDNTEKNEKFKIILEYSEVEYNEIIKKFESLSGSKEEIIYSLLNI